MAFFGGSAGVIYRQFSLTIVSAMVLSVFVALVLTPALCATILKPVPTEAKGREGFFGAFNRGSSAAATSTCGGVRNVIGSLGRWLLVYAR